MLLCEPEQLQGARLPAAEFQCGHHKLCHGCHKSISVPPFSLSYGVDHLST